MPPEKGMLQEQPQPSDIATAEVATVLAQLEVSYGEEPNSDVE